MPTTTMSYTLTINNRQQMRNDIIDLFKNEQPGTGTGANAARYIYEVENFNNYKIQLCRPANLNKGFDFTVNITGLYFKKKRCYSNPSHKDVISALLYCKQNYPNYQSIIIPLINDIYNCKNITVSQSGITFLDYNGQQHPIEIILLALKWLFIEQDFTYWNNSGRSMLYNSLKSNNLV